MFRLHPHPSDLGLDSNTSHAAWPQWSIFCISRSVISSSLEVITALALLFRWVAATHTQPHTSSLPVRRPHGKNTARLITFLNLSTTLLSRLPKTVLLPLLRLERPEYALHLTLLQLACRQCRDDSDDFQRPLQLQFSREPDCRLSKEKWNGISLHPSSN